MDKSLEKVVGMLKLGQPVIFPTDTVWGIGVAVEYCPSPKPLFEAKGRSAEKPVAWLVGTPAALSRYGQDVPEYAQELAAKHWPGALTLVVEAAPSVPAAFRSETGTIGLRMPDSAEALALIDAVGCPLATTSANPSGTAAIPAACEMDKDFVAVSGVEAYAPSVAKRDRGSIASTVVDCTGPHPKVLRQGPIQVG